MSFEQKEFWLKGREYERERIRINILDRVQDLSACNKADNCKEFGALIASYVEEWIDEADRGTNVKNLGADLANE